MNWDDVRIFLAVARSGQILGAARRLDLNHATVSRRLAALEEALRTRLFRRTTTGSELTPAGERFLGIAERMEADMITARAEIAGEGDEVSGTVRIGAPDGFGVAYLAPRLGALAAQHRELKVQLVPVPRTFSLSRREADIAITTERPAEGRLVAGKLVEAALKGDTTSQIFYLKTQAGWKETSRQEHTGADGKPIQYQELGEEEIDARLAELAAEHGPKPLAH